MSDNMDIVAKRLVNLTDGDKIITKQITENIIEKIFNDNGYNHLKLKTIFESSKFTAIEKIAINELFWNFKYIHKLPLFDVMSFLLQFSDPNKILKVIDSELLIELKHEIIKTNTRIKKLETNREIEELMQAFARLANE